MTTDTTTEQSETERQAEQMISQLAGWVKQQVVANASLQRLIDDQKALIDQQREEIERLRKRPTPNDHATLHAALADVVKQRDAAVADNAALREALEEYGEHLTGCTHCNCGLDTITGTDHPGDVILSELDSARNERNEAAYALTRCRRECKSLETARDYASEKHDLVMQAYERVVADRDQARRWGKAWKHASGYMRACRNNSDVISAGWRHAYEVLKREHAELNAGRNLLKHDRDAWQRRARTWKVAAKSNRSALVLFVHDAQQRIAELEAAGDAVREWIDTSVIGCPSYELIQDGRHLATVECMTTVNGIRWYWYTNDHSHLSLDNGVTYDDAESAQRAAYTWLRSKKETPNDV